MTHKKAKYETPVSYLMDMTPFDEFCAQLPGQIGSGGSGSGDGVDSGDVLTREQGEDLSIPSIWDSWEEDK